nr:conserved membrane protein of unknown function [Candidatus Magnetococcus massalia]
MDAHTPVSPIEEAPVEGSNGQAVDEVKKSPPQPPPSQKVAVNFHGELGAYYRIWIVNWALTILTLGIFSAWAKVRTQRFINGHTELDGHHFEYTANPLKILKGRLIALAILSPVIFQEQIIQWLHMSDFAQSLSGELFTMLLVLFGIVPIVVLFIAMPWFLVKGKQFQLFNTRYRGIRFQFHGTSNKAFLPYFVLPTVSFITLGLLAPYTVLRMKRFLVHNLGFGSQRLVKQEGKQDIAKESLIYSGLLPIAFLIIMMVLAFLLTAATGGGPVAGAPLIPVFVGFGAMMFIPFYRTWLEGKMLNGLWNSAELGDLRFSSTIRPTKLAWISVSNAIVRVLSLGMLSPWCTLRMLNYRYSSMQVEVAGDAQAFIAQLQDEQSAVGEGGDDLLGIDAGF